MTVVLVDAKYFGAAIRRGRRNACIGRRDLGVILRITHRELAKYENGRAVIPDDILARIITNGIVLLKTRKFNQKN
ncbi:MAG: helix-turn-helix domain-containing protein [Alphaproteobacteria bacterium]|nr:helix-turn-helix domain-containing protein [Alphaproteobacteria bacterium]